MHNEPVAADEDLCRYVMDRSSYRSSDGRVKHNAFMPAMGGDLSVYRTDKLESSEIFEIGLKFVAGPRGKELLGFATVKANVPLANGLRIIGTELPHPRHANITHWPGGTGNRLIAIKIAEAATLQLTTLQGS